MTELHPLLISYYDEIDPPKRYAYLKEYAEAVGSGMSLPMSTGLIFLMRGIPIPMQKAFSAFSESQNPPEAGQAAGMIHPFPILPENWTFS